MRAEKLNSASYGIEGGREWKGEKDENNSHQTYTTEHRENKQAKEM